MKKICGIICEFNPLHEGHIFLLREARRIGDAVVCIMSGNFVQRGEAAVFDKYTRAKAAMEAGADLVMELPFPWCAAPAEFFARSGVSLASAAGVSDLVFGSECGDLQIIKRAAALCDDPSFSVACDELYRGNVGYAKARYDAAKSIAPEDANVFKSSNDALATEYIRQGKKLGLAGEFHAIGRLPGFSATEIRGRLGRKNSLFDIERTVFCLGKYSEDSFDSESGILNRLEKCAEESVDGYDMFERAATKKYTDARLRRAALFALTGTKREDLARLPDFTLLLAANDMGREIVKSIDAVEVVTKPADAKSAQFGAEAFADRLFALSSPDEMTCGEFLKKSPIIY